MPLAAAQLFLEKCIQGFLLAFPSEPQRLAGFQVAHHRQELLLLADVDLIHAHLPECRFAPTSRPSLQIAQVDRAHRTLRQAEPSCHLSRGRTLTRLPYRILEALTERRFARPGHFTRYTSMCTVVVKLLHGKSRTAR